MYPHNNTLISAPTQEQRPPPPGRTHNEHLPGAVDGADRAADHHTALLLLRDVPVLGVREQDHRAWGRRGSQSGMFPSSGNRITAPGEDEAVRAGCSGPRRQGTGSPRLGKTREVRAGCSRPQGTVSPRLGKTREVRPYKGTARETGMETGPKKVSSSYKRLGQKLIISISYTWTQTEV